MRITILYNDNNGCDYHRLLLPSEYFELSSGDVLQKVKYEDCYKNLESFKCDILLLKRMVFKNWEGINKLKKINGFKIILDIDDYYELPYNHLYYTSWKSNKMGERLIEACKNSDLLLVTNEELKNIYEEFNNNIEIVPNSLPFDSGQFINEKTNSEKIRFLYASGSTHYNDLKSIKGLFMRLGSDGDFKKRAKFILCGYNNPKNNKNNAWNKIEGICKFSKSYERRETLSLNSYMNHYNYGDIAIAPLENTFFNTCKSNLKFLEASVTKKPFICSNTNPYKKDTSKGIIFCNNVNDWYKAFKFFINNPNAIEDYGNFNYEYTKERYNLKEINKKRIEIFNNLVY